MVGKQSTVGRTPVKNIEEGKKERFGERNSQGHERSQDAAGQQVEPEMQQEALMETWSLTGCAVLRPRGAGSPGEC